ncbi:WD repeat-containing protein 18 [Galendromus occidentalis]|uniref:WD repeat-containing protein 18 n=1 Tax=Galendromus occidentalis TaxID=34638 RepID=A0AAJ6QV77_9ACAR|nr:WD repeat-containing protein 18 [Galendromus occidentalis]
MAVRNVAYTTDGAGNYNVRVWNLETGGPLSCYTGGVSQPRTLSFIKGDYILSAQKDKTAFSLWSFRQYEQSTRRFAAPDKVRALAVSPSGNHCVAGIGCELYLWEVSTGALIGSIQAHFQPVTVVKFTDDGTSVISASHDSSVSVWPIDCFHPDEIPEPDMTFKDHNQAIQDMCVVGSLVTSVSSAGLLTVHSLQTGCLEYRKFFGKVIDSVDMTPSMDAVFVGFKEGTIVRLSLKDESQLEFVGHNGPVRCLSVSTHLLLSGSDDATARIWDAEHGHLLQTLRHDGAVTNVRIASFPSNALSKEANKSKALASVCNFQRAFSKSDVTRQSHDRLEEEQENVAIEVKPCERAQEELSIPPQTRDMMKKIAIANTDIVNFVVASL